MLQAGKTYTQDTYLHSEIIEHTGIDDNIIELHCPSWGTYTVHRYSGDHNSFNYWVVDQHWRIVFNPDDTMTRSKDCAAYIQSYASLSEAVDKIQELRAPYIGSRIDTLTADIVGYAQEEKESITTCPKNMLTSAEIITAKEYKYTPKFDVENHTKSNKTTQSNYTDKED